MFPLANFCLTSSDTEKFAKSVNVEELKASTIDFKASFVFKFISEHVDMFVLSGFSILKVNCKSKFLVQD